MQMKKLIALILSLTLVVTCVTLPASAKNLTATFNGDLLRTITTGWLSGIYQTGGFRVHYTPGKDNSEGNFLEVKSDKLYINVSKNNENTCLQFDFDTIDNGIAILSADIKFEGLSDKTVSDAFGGIVGSAPTISGMSIVTDNGSYKLNNSEVYNYMLAFDLNNKTYSLYINGGLVSQNNPIDISSIKRWQFNIKSGDEAENGIVVEFDNVTLTSTQSMPDNDLVKNDDVTTESKISYSYMLSTADTNGTIYEDAVGFMAGVGLVSKEDSFYPENLITRGELVDLIVKFYRFVTAADSIPFKDVKKNHKYYKSICAAYDYKIIDGDVNGDFHPDGNVPKDEALAMVVRALGYGAIAEASAGYSKNYYQIAAENNLLSVIKLDGKAITKGDFARLLFATLEVRMLSYSRNEINFDNLTVLENIFNGRKISGIVSADERSSLYGTRLFEGNMEITSNGTNVVYNSEKIGYVDVIGEPVTAYITEDNDEWSIVYIKERRDLERLDLDASEILYGDAQFDIYNIIYQENNKTKKAPIEKTAVFCYNGEVTDNISEEDIYIQSGSLKLVDTDANGKYDIVKITKYENKIVEYIDTDGNLYFKDGTQLPYKSDRKEYVVKGKRTILLNKIAANDVLMIAQTKSGDYLNVIVNNGKKELSSTNVTSIKGKGELYYLDNGVLCSKNNYEIVTSKQTYSYSIEYLKNATEFIQIGKGAVIFVNAVGEIVDIDFDSITRRYAYLVRVISDTEVSDDDVKVKMFTQDNEMVMLNARDKVRVDVDRIDRLQLLNSYYGLVRADGTTIPQLVAYETNANGELSVIEKLTPDTTSNFEYTNVGTTRMLKNVNNTYGHQVVADITNSVIFAVPMNKNTDDNDRYSIIRSSNLNAVQGYSGVQLFDMNDLCEPGAVLVNSNTNTAHSPFLYMFVEKVLASINDNDEETKSISGINLLNGTPVTITTNGIDGWNDIKSGQLLMYSLDQNGLAVNQGIFTINDNAVPAMLYKKIGESYAIAIMKFHKQSGNKLIYSFDGVNKYPLPMSAVVFEYSKSRGKLTEASVNNLINNDQIVVMINGFTVRAIIVYKD